MICRPNYHCKLSYTNTSSQKTIFFDGAPFPYPLFFFFWLRKDWRLSAVFEWRSLPSSVLTCLSCSHLTAALFKINHLLWIEAEYYGQHLSGLPRIDLFFFPPPPLEVIQILNSCIWIPLHSHMHKWMYATGGHK